MTFEERRKTLADFLEFEVQPRLDGAKFDMGTWGSVDNETGRGIPPRSNDIDRLSECGFAGCAAGWGAFCPALKKEGIPVRRRVSFVAASYDELADFFGLDMDNTERIFNPFRYDVDAYEDVTIPEVVERLRAAVDARGLS